MTNRQKAEQLLQQMTLTEKVGQLAQHFFGFNAYTRDEQGEIVLTQEFKDYVLRFGGLESKQQEKKTDKLYKPVIIERV